MPSKTAKQRRFMAAACRGKTRKRISKKVACKYHKADKAKSRKKRK